MMLLLNIIRAIGNGKAVKLKINFKDIQFNCSLLLRL